MAVPIIIFYHYYEEKIVAYKYRQQPTNDFVFASILQKSIQSHFLGCVKMDNLGVFSTVLEYMGRLRPTSIMAYVCAVLNFVLFAYCIIKLYKSTGLNIQNGMVFLASLIGTICSVIYYTVDTTKGAGFITLNTLYYALVWLSFISIFPLWARKLHSAGVKTHLGVAKALSILVYVYALITIAVAIVAETKVAGAASSFESFETDHEYFSDDLPIFMYLMYFLSTQNFMYVIVTFVLLCMFLEKVSRLSAHNYKISAAVFFIFATIAVITDTAMMFTANIFRFAEYPLISEAMITLILVNFCNCIALLVVLIFSSKWRSSFDKSQYIPSSAV